MMNLFRFIAVTFVLFCFILEDAVGQVVVPDNAFLYKLEKLIEDSSNQAVSLSREWIIKELDDSKGTILPWVYYDMGRSFFKLHQYDSAELYYHKAIEYGNKYLFLDMVADCYSKLSWVYFKKADYNSGISSAMEAIRIFEPNNNYKGLSKTYSNMAANYSQIKNLDDYKKTALKYQKESLKYGIQAGDSSFLMIVYNNLATFYMDNNYPDSALLYLNHCFNFKNVDGYDKTVIRVYSNLSLLYYDHLNKPQKGWQYDTLSYNYYKRKNDKFQQALLATNLGFHRLKAKDYRTALKYYEEAIRLSEEMGIMNNLMGTYKNLSNLYVLMGDYEKALEAYKCYHQNYQSFYFSERNKDIEKLKTEFETERKEKQITVLQQEAKIKELEINQRIRQRNIFIAIAILVVIIALVLLFVFQERQKAALALAEKNEALAKQEIDKLISEQDKISMQALIEGQEKERQRIAQDLHDQLGAMLSAVKLNFSAIESKIRSNGNGFVSQYHRAIEMLDLAVGEVRRISHNMSSGILSRFGLQKALENLKETMERSSDMKVDLMLYDVESGLDNKIELQVYRIVQELFANILKHAKASEVIVQLVHGIDELMLTVEDDGVGFNPEEKKGGIGIGNIVSRVESLGGTAYFDSGLGSGTTVSIAIPTIYHGEKH